MTGHIGVGNVIPRESNGGIPVNLQDQTSPPIDALFAQEVSPFTLSVDTAVSTVSVLVYTFEATAGHLIVSGNEILLLDVDGDRSFYAIVTNVSVNTITVDRPIDHAFPSASTLGRRVITNMAVDGSSTPQIFSLRAGSVPIDITRFIMTVTDASPMDTGTFGGMSALSNGFVFRILNSYQKTIFNFKSNGEIEQMAFDIRYTSKAPAGEYGLVSMITFAGQSSHGVTLRISNLDVMQWIVQDDLRDLLTLRCVGQGHEVTD